jgi:hypothetical protein
MEEIEDHAADILGKSQEGQSIDDNLSCIPYLALRCGFKTAIGVKTQISVNEHPQ